MPPVLRCSIVVGWVTFVWPKITGGPRPTPAGAGLEADSSWSAPTGVGEGLPVVLDHVTSSRSTPAGVGPKTAGDLGPHNQRRRSEETGDTGASLVSTSTELERSCCRRYSSREISVARLEPNLRYHPPNCPCWGVGGNPPAILAHAKTTQRQRRNALKPCIIKKESARHDRA